MYHSVKSYEREQFAQQMSLLERVAHLVPADFDGKVPDDRCAVAVTFDDAYQSVLVNAVPILRERKIPFTVFTPTKCLGGKPGWISDERHRDANETLLTEDELQCVRQAGGVIGSHSVTHRSLTELSIADAFAELAESREVLERTAGTKVDLFALPYGTSDDTVLRLAKRAGYQRVFLSVPVDSNANDDALLCGRIDVTPSDWALEYHLKILGAYQWLPLAIATKRRLRNLLRPFRVQVM
jgi:peptidoglycan/xylan/chitin deacetylase (PgdA/CDA1 family)